MNKYCKMFFKKIEYKNLNKPKKNFIFLHQLLGNHTTFLKLTKFFENFSNEFEINCYLLDFRNHGL
jgi:hypothetical protein